MPAGRPREFDTEKALEAALLLFWQRGYEGTSLSALTQAMGINVPSLYAAFGNKEALFRLALDRYLKNPASYLPKALTAPTAREAAERLLQGAISMTMNPRHPDGCLLVHGALVSGPDSESVRAELSRRREGAQRAVERRFERAKEEGEFPSGVDAAALARYIVTVVWGLSVQATGGASRAHLQEIAKHAMQTWPSRQHTTSSSVPKPHPRRRRRS